MKLNNLTDLEMKDLLIRRGMLLDDETDSNVISKEAYLCGYNWNEGTGSWIKDGSHFVESINEHIESNKPFYTSSQKISPLLAILDFADDCDLMITDSEVAITAEKADTNYNHTKSYEYEIKIEPLEITLLIELSRLNKHYNFYMKQLNSKGEQNYE